MKFIQRNEIVRLGYDSTSGKAEQGRESVGESEEEIIKKRLIRERLELLISTD